MRLAVAGLGTIVKSYSVIILSKMCQYRNVKVRQLQFNNTHFVSNIFFFLSSFFSKLTGVSLTYIFTILSPLPLE